MPLNLNAQFDEDLGIKEKFDDVYAYNFGNNVNWDRLNEIHGTDANPSVFNSNYKKSVAMQNWLGSTSAHSQEALLVMWEATKCPEYLNQFIINASKIINARADKVIPAQSIAPYWFKTKIVWHARILSSLSKFVYMVNIQHNAELSMFQFPSDIYINGVGLVNNIIDFSNIVRQNNEEVMDLMILKQWPDERITDINCFYKITEDTVGYHTPTIWRTCNWTTPMELNYQTEYGVALVYMYQTATSYSKKLSYGIRAVRLAQAHLVLNHNNVAPFLPNGPGIYNYNSTWNSISWGQAGWSFILLREDIAHGSLDIRFPIIYSKFRNTFGSITSGMYFEPYQMVRLKNNFTFNIYNLDYATTDNLFFNANVDGTNFEMFIPKHYIDMANGNLVWASHYYRIALQLNGIGYINLYKYDGLAGSNGDDVYDILMDYYVKSIKWVGYLNESDKSKFLGVKMLNLAEMCYANYDKSGLLGTSICVSRRGGDSNEKLIPEDLEIIIFPNPTSNYFSLKIPDDTDVNIIIYSITGQQVLSTKQTKNIDVSTFPKGIYLVMIEIDGMVENKKLIIE